MWTKNLELAIEAFRRFRERTPEPETWRLRIAGIVDRKSEPYLAAATLAGADPAIEFRVHPEEEELRSFYRTCFGTLFTAFNEDWGLVVIEAMATASLAWHCAAGPARSCATTRTACWPSRRRLRRGHAPAGQRAGPARADRGGGSRRRGTLRLGGFISALDGALEEALPGRSQRPPSSVEGGRRMSDGADRRPRTPEDGSGVVELAEACRVLGALVRRRRDSSRCSRRSPWW